MKKPFFYELPRERIAQRPVHPCDAARLLIADRRGGVVAEATFAHLEQALRAGDLLVFNDSRVIPARLLGRFENGAAVEVLLHRRISQNRWRCLGQPLKKFRAGRSLTFESGLSARVGERLSPYEVELEFLCSSGELDDVLARCGSMPIPPYIRDGRGDDEDRRDYQSIFARVDGSVAAPTASLHFTASLMNKLAAAGIGSARLTLHVGAASFLPLFDGGCVQRRPGPEAYVFDPGLLEACRRVRERGARVIAVGTTVVRALESMSGADFALEKVAQDTELFIEPGYDFKLVDGLITNFHQPGTTHLLLVEAFMGRELLSRCYDYALCRDFRFLSYGDGMLIL